MGDELGRDLIGQVVARVVHGAQDAFDAQAGVATLAYLFDGVEQRGQAFERVILALDRNQHAMRRDQGVEREHVERGRAVDDDQLIGADRRGQYLAQALLAVGRIEQPDLGGGQIGIGRQQVESGRGFGDALETVGDGHVGQKQITGRMLDLMLVDPATHGRVALRIEIDQEHTAAHERQRSGQIDRRGGLADPALLVGDRDDVDHGRLSHSGVRSDDVGHRERESSADGRSASARPRPSRRRLRRRAPS